MKGRVSYLATPLYIKDIGRQIEKYPNYDIYLLGSFSYLVKLNLDIPISKYDTLNNELLLLFILY